MSVIFLDIDGVLNSLKAFEKLKESGELETMTMVFTEYIKRLERLIDATNADIVISSTWRKSFINGYDKPDALGISWTYYLGEKIANKIIGMTPYNMMANMTRGHEILLWLLNWILNHYLITISRQHGKTGCRMSMLKRQSTY